MGKLTMAFTLCISLLMTILTIPVFASIWVSTATPFNVFLIANLAYAPAPNGFILGSGIDGNNNQTYTPPANNNETAPITPRAYQQLGSNGTIVFVLMIVGAFLALLLFGIVTQIRYERGKKKNEQNRKRSFPFVNGRPDTEDDCGLSIGVKL